MRLSTITILLAAEACSGTPSPGRDAAADAVTDIPAVAPMPWPPPLVPLAEAPQCPEVDQPPCVVEVVSYADPLAQIGATLCCKQPGYAILALAVDSTVGPWGDVTEWAICGQGYVFEVTHPNRAGTPPWAVLDTYDGHGGPISECASALAPQDRRRILRMLDSFTSSR